MPTPNFNAALHPARNIISLVCTGKGRDLGLYNGNYNACKRIIRFWNCIVICCEDVLGRDSSRQAVESRSCNLKWMATEVVLEVVKSYVIASKDRLAAFFACERVRSSTCWYRQPLRVETQVYCRGRHNQQLLTTMH